MQHIGIVLKHYIPKRQTVALLDNRLGRIYAIVKGDKALSAGTILAYELEHKRNYYLLRQPELVDMPLVLARTDMLFLHHVLELCYYFVPEGSKDDHVYQLLCFVVRQSLVLKKQQKNILCILSALFGMYPEGIALFIELADAIEREPLHTLINREIDIKIEKSIGQWLYQCIQMQTCAPYLKTVHFLNEI